MAAVEGSGTGPGVVVTPARNASTSHGGLELSKENTSSEWFASNQIVHFVSQNEGEKCIAFDQIIGSNHDVIADRTVRHPAHGRAVILNNTVVQLSRPVLRRGRGIPEAAQNPHPGPASHA
jgi:hypothetical protein